MYNIRNNTVASTNNPAANAATKIGPYITDNDGNIIYTYITTFKNDYLNTVTDLAIATTTIHESIHSMLFFLKQNGYLNSISENSSYEELMEAFCNLLITSGYNPFTPITGTPQHDIMFHLIGNIADSLKQYGVSKGYNLPDSYYNAMAWGGLTTTDAFNELYRDSNGNLNSDGEYIYGTIWAEEHNSPAQYSDGSPVLHLGHQIIPLSPKCQN
ncbi:hypothetical protein AM493_10735 [Flavobacterium akiainvivens]|uniref:Uncharacterized protein n=1 Tax=Flavobacterium akiainvivens TaxID=1202724 RepID=A0A0M8MIU3_9FLAO|nr:hypothetical protein [Flavobacterium akiainvivens]KOS06458.1 hypothetical protein AM493_10735 [Flavobacterium akiainvivens]SFQ13077.1 hypothetical protein SAMN05444144_101215 [Flavobacterium akiainvivens]